MPWDPARDLLTMQERLESLFGRADPGWVPPVDLFERADLYILTVEVPGLRREDIQIGGGPDSIVVSGHRAGQPTGAGKYHQFERGQGHFSRSFRFGQSINLDGITAELADGVLTITIPKAQVSAGHIEIR